MGTQTQAAQNCATERRRKLRQVAFCNIDLDLQIPRNRPGGLAPAQDTADPCVFLLDLDPLQRLYRTTTSDRLART